MATTQHLSRKMLLSRAGLFLALVLIAGGLLMVTNQPGSKGLTGNAAPVVTTATCTVNITNPVPASVSCTVSNSNPSPGEVVTYTATPANGASGPYTWAPTDASKCVAGTGSTKNCTFTTPGALYAMSVTATGTGSPSDTCPTINVKTPSAYIEAVPDRVAINGTVDVKWSADQVSTCTVTRDGTSVWSQTLTSPTTSIATTTLSPQPTITKQTTFAISCDGASASDTVIVNVVPKFEEF